MFGLLVQECYFKLEANSIFLLLRVQHCKFLSSGFVWCNDIKMCALSSTRRIQGVSNT